MYSVVTVVLVIQLVGEAGLFELAVLAGGAVLGVLLGGVPRCFTPLPLAILVASAALYALGPIQGPSAFQRWNAEGPWIGPKAYKAADATNIANGNGVKNPVLNRPQHPSLGTPPSRTQSTAPAARAASSKRSASPTSWMTSTTVTTEHMEVIHYLPTHFCTSLVTVTTLMSTPCITHAASQWVTAPLHSSSLLYSTPMLTPLRLSIGK